jgi:hypothetical protein
MLQLGILSRAVIIQDFNNLSSSVGDGTSDSTLLFVALVYSVLLQQYLFKRNSFLPGEIKVSDSFRVSLTAW